MMGYVLRYLDCTNEKEADVIRGVLRMILEGRRTGIGRKVLQKVVKKVGMSAWCDMAAARRALDWNENQAEAFMMMYDYVETHRLEGRDAVGAAEEALGKLLLMKEAER